MPERESAASAEGAAAGAMTATGAPEDDARATPPCPRCGERFSRARYLALHAGIEHADDLAPAERGAYEAAVAEEDVWLASLRRRVKGGLAALPIVLTYLFILVLLHLAQVPLVFGLLLIPVTAACAAIVYHLVSTRELQPGYN